MLSMDIRRDIAQVDAQLETARAVGDWLQAAAREAELTKLRRDLRDARRLERDAAADRRAAVAASRVRQGNA